MIIYRAIIVIKALCLIARKGELIIPSSEYDNNRNRTLTNEYLEITWYDFSNVLDGRKEGLGKLGVCTDSH